MSDANSSAQKPAVARRYRKDFATQEEYEAYQKERKRATQKRYYEKNRERLLEKAREKAKSKKEPKNEGAKDKAKSECPEDKVKEETDTAIQRPMLN